MATNNTDGFLNPYNFVPFPRRKSEKYKGDPTDCHSGVVEYTITTKTPLFIPNTSNAGDYRADEHKSFDFFSYTQLNGKTEFNKFYEPVIPGSELRGMIRSIYETLTASCMGVFNAEVRPIKRTPQFFEAGLIHKTVSETGETYELVRAQDIVYNKKKEKDFIPMHQTRDFKEGQQVFFALSNAKRSQKSNAPVRVLAIYDKYANDHKDSGYVIKGMNSPGGKNKKHNLHIFRYKGNVITKLEKSDLDGLKMVLKDYQEQPQSKGQSYTEYRKNYETFLNTKEEGFYPVYYSQIVKPTRKPILYLSPAKITKEVSTHSLGELAKEWISCENSTKSCPACDLFGMIGKNNEDARGGHLRFSDASLVFSKGEDLQNYFEQPVTLQELAGPHLGNTEFYLNKPNQADFWTYDYYIKNGTLMIQPATLRGRKFYLNQPDVVLPKKVKPTQRNKTVHPVKRNVSFTGKMYFDNISSIQLNQLIWILNSGSRKADENDIVYKLGAGKPLGLGSIDLKISHITERKVCVKDGKLIYDMSCCDFRLEDIPSYDENEFDKDSKRSFLNLMSFEKMRGKMICYPMTKEQKDDSNRVSAGATEGYQWFIQNHDSKKMKKDRKEATAYYSLPLAESMKTLPYSPNPNKDKWNGQHNNNGRNNGSYVNKGHKYYQGKKR